MNLEQLGAIVEDLVEVLRLQAKDLERLVEHVEQVMPRMGYSPQLSVAAAKLNELHLRLQKLRGTEGQGG